MKKLVNEVGDIVPEMLEGLVAFDPALNRLPGWNVVVRADARQVADVGGVALVSGGGAGHEPAHAGYVGPGMLSAAVVGEVFTSPSVDAVLAAIRAVAGPGGVLLIVKNYTGDRLNFGLAAELARADGTAVEMVVVADDVALAAGGAHAGRRGIAGTVLVHKIAGAAAAAGLDLVAVRDAAQAAAAALGTMGVAFGACTVPAVGVPGFELGEDEIEWGLGIHGESGVEKTAIEPADDIVETASRPDHRRPGVDRRGSGRAAREQPGRIVGERARRRRPRRRAAPAGTPSRRRPWVDRHLPDGAGDAGLLAQPARARRRPDRLPRRAGVDHRLAVRSGRDGAGWSRSRRGRPRGPGDRSAGRAVRRPGLVDVPRARAGVRRPHRLRERAHEAGSGRRRR